VARAPESSPIDESDPIDWPFERFSYSLNYSVIDRFEAIARRFPNRPALSDRTSSLTYAELFGFVTCLAEATAAMVATRPGPVAILLSHETSFPAAILAVLAAGRGCIPLNADDPTARIQQIAGHASAVAVLSAGELAHEARGLFPDLPILDIREIQSAPPKADRSNADALAYIIYTSGSTGKPKGVYQNHRGLLQDIMECTNTQHISCEDRLALFSSPTNISGFRVTLSALLNGASLHLLRPRELQALGLVKEIRTRGITIFRSVPGLFRQVVDALDEGETLESVRLVVLGGDRVDWRDYELFKRACLPGAHFGVHLGATECSTLYLQWYVDDSCPRTGLLPVGRCMPERTTSLLDEKGRAVADGEVGEFVVSSRHLALGYWQAPDLTAQAFSTDPIDGLARVFKTGDLGRHRADGLFEHVGRKDDQIKLHGHRIEPAEIESTLRSIPAVADAAVIVRKDETGRPRSLVGYVVLRPGNRGLLPRHLQELLAQKLPLNWVPSQIILRDELPHLPNFKVDRVWLALVDSTRPFEVPALAVEDSDFVSDMRPERHTGHLASKEIGPFHFQLLEIWQRLLKRRDIDFNTNFFELGGDSLCATQMICEVEETTGFKIAQSALHGVFTINDLAETILHGLPARSELITSVKKGNGLPFFFCHGDYATRGIYALRLAELLVCDADVHLLHPFPDSDAHRPLEETARAYLRGLLASYPNGPFRLGGHCNGGLLAWEIAHQLEQLGRCVQVVALIDVPSVNARPLFRAISLLNNTIVAVAPRKTAKRFARSGMRAAWNKMGFPIGGLYSGTVASYVPERISSRVACLVSEESRAKAQYSPEPWSRLAPEVSSRFLPGNHLDCITKHAAVTAHVLDGLLQPIAK
jgi:amino acid adenylation domain-containing protein